MGAELGGGVGSAVTAEGDASGVEAALDSPLVALLGSVGGL